MKLFNARNAAFRITTVDSKSVFNVINVETCCVKISFEKNRNAAEQNPKNACFVVKICPKTFKNDGRFQPLY